MGWPSHNDQFRHRFRLRCAAPRQVTQIYTDLDLMWPWLRPLCSAAKLSLRASSFNTYSLDHGCYASFIKEINTDFFATEFTEKLFLDTDLH